MQSSGSGDDPEFSDLETVDRAELDTHGGPPPPAPGSNGALRPGSTVGAYRIEDRLGHGGFGEVWRAAHIDTGRVLALKVLTANSAVSEDAFERFRREGQLAASLTHRAAYACSPRRRSAATPPSRWS